MRVLPRTLHHTIAEREISTPGILARALPRPAGMCRRGGLGGRQRRSDLAQPAEPSPRPQGGCHDLRLRGRFSTFFRLFAVQDLLAGLHL